MRGRQGPWPSLVFRRPFVHPIMTSSPQSVQQTVAPDLKAPLWRDIQLKYQWFRLKITRQVDRNNEKILGFETHITHSAQMLIKRASPSCPFAPVPFCFIPRIYLYGKQLINFIYYNTITPDKILMTIIRKILQLGNDKKKWQPATNKWYLSFTYLWIHHIIVLTYQLKMISSSNVLSLNQQ